MRAKGVSVSGDEGAGKGEQMIEEGEREKEEKLV